MRPANLLRKSQSQWLCSGQLWLSFSMQRLQSTSSCVYPSYQQRGTAVQHTKPKSSIIESIEKGRVRSIVNKEIDKSSSHNSPAECVHVLSEQICCMALTLTRPFNLLCRWRSVFNLRIWNWLSPYWNKCFFTMIMVLIVLFLGKQLPVSDRH